MLWCIAHTVRRKIDKLFNKPDWEMDDSELGGKGD